MTFSSVRNTLLASWKPLLLSVVCTVFPAAICNAGPIGILAIPSGVTSSGNGTLDLRMFTHSGGEIDNMSGTFDGDDANTTLQTGVGDMLSFSESYFTTVAELREFYELNFPNPINEIVLFLDLNETGPGSPMNHLSLFEVISNPTGLPGSPDPSLDLTGAQQALIGQTYSGGTLEAYLFDPPENLPVVSNGGGFADHALFTGIDPYSLNASDTILFNISMNFLSNGPDKLFVSGTFAGSDIGVPDYPEDPSDPGGDPGGDPGDPGIPHMPEPSSGVLLGIGILALAGARCRRKRKTT